MIALDEDALICDLAETYHVLNYRELPLRLVATLASGLGPNSRIKQKQYGLKVPIDMYMRAIMIDQLSYIRWLNTKDAQKGVNRPELISVKLTDHTDKAGQFETPDEFEKFRASLVGGR